MSSSSSASSSGTYRAVVLSGISKNFADGVDSLVLTDVPRRALTDNEVRVSMYASAVNFFDLLITTNQYQFKPSLPFIMGSESSGVIVELGSAVTNRKVGDEVMMSLSMGQGMAEEAVVDADSLISKPATFSHVQAAAFSVGYLTAYNGLAQRGQLKAGESVLITGAGGGMGLAAVQLARALGASTVIAAASSGDKLSACLKAGATHTINYSLGKDEMRNRVHEITGGRMVDMVYEVVGGDIFAQSLRCLAMHGRLLVVGFAGGKIPSVAANYLLVKCISVVGVASGANFAQNSQLLTDCAAALQKLTSADALRKVDLRPHVERIYAPKEFKAAFKAVADRKIVGKAVVQWREDTKKAKL